MSDNVISAENQQATEILKNLSFRESSETICQTPSTKSEIIAYLNGALHDASLNKGKRIRFAQKNRQWLENLHFLLKQLNCNSWIYKEGKKRDIYVLETLCTYLNFEFNPSNLKDSREKLFYIRGFFDAEGGIPHKKGRFYIQLVQKDFEKIRKLKCLLKDIGIKSGKIHNPSKRVDPNYWRIFILSKYHKRFAEIINSYHPIKIKIFRERMKR